MKIGVNTNNLCLVLSDVSGYPNFMGTEKEEISECSRKNELEICSY